MERNDDFSTPSTGMGGTSGAGSTGSDFGTSAGGSDFQASTGSNFGTTGASGGTAGDASSRVQQGKEAVADKLGAVKEKVQNLNVKEKVSNLNASLADKLEAGADKLRQRAQSGQLAGAGSFGATTGVSDERLAQYGDKAAVGLESAADWLRNGDLKASVEEQVRTNPGRTLLIALGLGYVLGKALRK